MHAPFLWLPFFVLAAVPAALRRNPRVTTERPAVSQQQGNFFGRRTLLGVASKPFFSYYEAQGIFKDGDDLERFKKSLATPLPVTFRLAATASTRNVNQVLMQKEWKSFLDNLPTSEIGVVEQLAIERDLFKKPWNAENTINLTNNAMDEYAMIGAGKELKWYSPTGLAFQMPFGRKDCRKASVLKAFHMWLTAETDLGHCFRQEAVSMVPPLLLHVEPHHAVLDLCAAPGSKTAQLIEMLYPNGDGIEKDPDGFVIANDIDADRCTVLWRRLFQTKSTAFMITNHYAQDFPILYTESEKDGNNVSDTIGEATRRPLYFDRILCDVPCSGDGTIRKTADTWGRWSESWPKRLHQDQIKITMRAVDLLKPGGRLVYSTCSLNPIENEAVVAEVLRQTQGLLELVDTRNELPELKRRAGLSSWKVAGAISNGELPLYDSIADIPNTTQRRIELIKPSMFAPTAAEAKGMHLERCMRILPHDQNTGGFFVAVLEKTGPDNTHLRKSQGSSEIAAQHVVNPHPPGMDNVTIKDDMACVSERCKDMIRDRVLLARAGLKNSSDDIRLKEMLVSRCNLHAEESENGSVTYSLNEVVHALQRRGSARALHQPIHIDRAQDVHDKQENQKNQQNKNEQHLPREAFNFLQPDDPRLIDLETRFCFSELGLEPQNIYERGGTGGKQRLSYISPQLKKIFEGNEPTKLQACFCGVDLFGRSSKSLEFGFIQNGLPRILPRLAEEQLLEMSPRLFQYLLSSQVHNFDSLKSEMEDNNVAKEFHDLLMMKTGEQLRGIVDLVAVLKLDRGSAFYLPNPIYASCQRWGMQRLQVHVKKNELQHLRDTIGTIMEGVKHFVNKANAQLEADKQKIEAKAKRKENILAGRNAAIEGHTNVHGKK